MKKLLKRLQEIDISTYGDPPSNTERDSLDRRYETKFSKMVGRKALYISKSTKETRTVTIEKAYPRFVLVKYYKYRATTRIPETMCISYVDLYCGFASLDMNKEDR